MVLFTPSSLENFVHAKFFEWDQTNRNQKRPDLDLKEDVAVVSNQIDWWSQLFLEQNQALFSDINILRTQQQLT